MADLVHEASEYAARAHEGQYRKDLKTPYIVHPARVAATVAVCMYNYPMLEGITRNRLIAAGWLHDIIEDTEITPEELDKAFPEVADLVFALTNNKDPELPRAERKQLERARLAPAPEGVRLVKLADRLDNVMDLDGLPEDFQKLYAMETRQLVLALTANGMCNSGLQAAQGINEIIDPLLPQPRE